MILQLVLMLSLVAFAACSGEHTAETADPPDGAAVAISPDQYRARQHAIADSVLASALPVEKVVEQLGQPYTVGPDALRDTILALTEHTACFAAGRNTDPYLAGAVDIMARMTPTGTDLVRVLSAHTRWTSPSGELVNACLNSEMRKWKLAARYGPPAGYVVQVKFSEGSR